MTHFDTTVQNLDFNDFVNSWRAEIPLLQKKNPIVYLDNAATALKPNPVIDSMRDYYKEYPSNVHRGSYAISIRANEEYENARHTIKKFFNANDDYELIFTSGMTEGSNFIAQANREILTSSDKICSTSIEHHSSYLPWVETCKKTGAHLHLISCQEDGSLSLEKISQELHGARILSISGMSNVTGYIPNLSEILKLCQNYTCKMILDATQLAAHEKIDLTQTPYDAILCSAHKLGGPMGIGALCIKKSWLNELPTIHTGGGTVRSVSTENIVYLDSVERYEPGTPNVSGVIGFAKIIEFLNRMGWDNITHYEKLLHDKLFGLLSNVKGLRIIGSELLSNVAIASFVMENINAQDIAFILGQDNICIRNGKLCAEIFLQHMGCSQVTRVSAFCYNTYSELELVAQKLDSINSLFS